MNYFIEGLQGSGKSTMTEKISALNSGHTVIREGDHSPVELSWCAYVSDRKYHDILEKYPALRPQIEEKSFPEDDKRIICYTKIKTDDRSFYQDLEQYEIYNGRVSFDMFRETVLRRYKKWDSDNMIFECSLFQNIVEDLILFRQFSDDDIISFYRQVRDALSEKAYHIIYLCADDIPGNLQVIRKERCDENGKELWFPMLCGFFNGSPYAVSHGMKDEAGIIAHLTHRRDLELRLCKEIFPDRCTILPSKKYSNNDLLQFRS